MVAVDQRALVYLQCTEGQRTTQAASKAPFPLLKNQNIKAFQKTYRRLYCLWPELWYMASPTNKED